MKNLQNFIRDFEIKAKKINENKNLCGKTSKNKTRP